MATTTQQASDLTKRARDVHAKLAAARAAAEQRRQRLEAIDASLLELGFSPDTAGKEHARRQRKLEEALADLEASLP